MPVVSCWRNGAIEITRKQPRGSLLILRAPGRKLRPLVEVNARKAYDGKTLLVPGVPEAENDTQAYAAVNYFREILRMRLAGEQGWPKTEMSPFLARIPASPSKAGA